MTQLWFVTPAWRRVELTAVCLDQRATVIEALAGMGIDARCVVVADDENLDAARDRGFDVVRHRNVVSDKFNAGMAHAGRAGADLIVPIGSDSWVAPEFFERLTAAGTRTSPAYCHVTADRLLEARVERAAGAGPYVFHRRNLEPSGFRPAAPGLMSRVDSATIAGLRGPMRWDPVTRHPFQYVGFRVAPFITLYEALKRKWGVTEHANPWTILAGFYPPELVARARAILEREAAAAA